MSDRNANRPETDPGTIKDPSAWTTGDEPMTGAQESYLTTLARQAGEEAPEESLTKTEALQKINALREKAGVAQTTARREAQSKALLSAGSRPGALT